MFINKALFKYGYSNFIITILEYCNLDDLMVRETDYFSVYDLNYNILNTPDNTSKGLGWKRYQASIENIPNSPLIRFNENISVSNYNKISIEVTDFDNNKKITYHDIRGAARSISIDHKLINYYFYIDNNKPVLGKYSFKLIDTT